MKFYVHLRDDALRPIAVDGDYFEIDDQDNLTVVGQSVNRATFASGEWSHVLRGEEATA